MNCAAGMCAPGLRCQVLELESKKGQRESEEDDDEEEEGEAEEGEEEGEEEEDDEGEEEVVEEVEEAKESATTMPPNALLAVPAPSQGPGGADSGPPVASLAERPPGWPEKKFAGEMASIVELWDLCQVSIVHRTEVYLLMRGLPSDMPYLSLERRRLQWLRQQWFEDAEANPTAHAERQVLHPRVAALA